MCGIFTCLNGCLKGRREQSTEVQKADIEAYLKSKGITEFQIYEDTEEFQNLKRWATTKEANTSL